MTHAALGRVAKVTSRRTVAPRLVMGQWIAIVQANVYGAKPSFTFEIFEGDAEAHARARGRAALATAEGGTCPPEVLAASEAAKPHIAGMGLNVDRSSFFSCCRSWKHLLGEDELEAPDEEPSPPSLVGRKVVNLSVIVDVEGEPEIVSVNGIVTHDPSAGGRKYTVTYEDPSGEKSAKADLARVLEALAPLIIPLDLSESPAELVKLLQSMDKTRSSSLAPSTVEAGAATARTTGDSGDA